MRVSQRRAEGGRGDRAYAPLIRPCRAPCSTLLPPGMKPGPFCLVVFAVRLTAQERMIQIGVLGRRLQASCAHNGRRRKHESGQCWLACAAVNPTTSWLSSSRNSTLKLWKSRPAGRGRARPGRDRSLHRGVLCVTTSSGAAGRAGGHAHYRLVSHLEGWPAPEDQGAFPAGTRCVLVWEGRARGSRPPVAHAPPRHVATPQESAALAKRTERIENARSRRAGLQHVTRGSPRQAVLTGCAQNQDPFPLHLLVCVRR